MKTDDAREGLMSFIERRDGRFTGKPWPASWLA
jgi:hypothetical protein